MWGRGEGGRGHRAGSVGRHHQHYHHHHANPHSSVNQCLYHPPTLTYSLHHHHAPLPRTRPLHPPTRPPPRPGRSAAPPAWPSTSSATPPSAVWTGCPTTRPSPRWGAVWPRARVCARACVWWWGRWGWGRGLRGDCRLRPVVLLARGRQKGDACHLTKLHAHPTKHLRHPCHASQPRSHLCVVFQESHYFQGGQGPRTHVLQWLGSGSRSGPSRV